MEEVLQEPKSGGRPMGDPGTEPHPLLRRLRSCAAADGRFPWLVPVLFLAVSLVIGAAAVGGTVYTTGCGVTVDGIQVGTVKTAAEFERVAEQTEDRISDILGHTYTLDSEITYDRTLVKRNAVVSADGLESYLMDRCGAVMQRYVLKVDGVIIGAAGEEGALTALLERIQAPYRTENTERAEFVADVTVTREYVPADTSQDLTAMEEYLTANTTGETVYEVQAGDTFMQLAFDNGMTMSELQELNPEVDVDRIYVGQLLNVKEEIPFLSVRTVEQVTYHEAVECPVEEVEDDSMYQGDSRVLDPGVEGDSLVTADVIYVNGKEEERDVVSSTILREPTTKVVAVGTMERPSWLPNGYFIWPVYGTITSSFGYRNIFGSTSYHGGLDIAAPYGTRIAAADGGTVEFAGLATGNNWSYGNLVIVNHGDGRRTYYGHCSKVLVSVGDKVYQGQTVALVGSTGRSTGNHCHFEVRINGTRVNPRSYLP